jgi:hypothetical protein
MITSGSELSVAEGSLRQATNVNIDEDGVITPRRGFAEYGNPTEPTISARVKQMFEYKERLFRHYQDQIQYEDSTGQFQDIPGSFTELRNGYRIKYQESKGNMYFTTNEGIKRISLKNSPNGNVKIEQAGVPKAAYMEGEKEDTVGGFLSPQSKVGYRFIFGRKDANNNLLLGSASARHIVTNGNERQVDFQTTTLTFVNDKASYNTTGSDHVILYTQGGRKYTFVFQPTSEAVNLPLNTNTFGSVFIKVDIQNTTGTSDIAAVFANEIVNNVPEYDVFELTTNVLTVKSNIEGTFSDQVITTVTPNIITGSIVKGEVKEGEQANTKLKLIIPSNITTDYFIQLYRTAPITASFGLTLDDIDPGDECNLVYETAVTFDHIQAGQIEITDTTPETFRASGASLYSNEITGEGLLQSNDPPPIALDITLFRNSMFYANTKSSHRLQFNILSVDDYERNKTRFIIGNSKVSRFYTASDEELLTEEGGEFILSDSLSTAIQIDATSRSLVKVINQDPDSPVNAYYLTGVNNLPGQILLEARSFLDDPFYISIESGYNAYNGSVSYFKNDRVQLLGKDYVFIFDADDYPEDWDTLNTYNKDIIVLYLGKKYKSLVPNNIGNQPDTSPTQWQDLGIIDLYTVGDIVEYIGVNYECILDTTVAAEKPINETYWQVYIPNSEPDVSENWQTFWKEFFIEGEFNPEITRSKTLNSLTGTSTPSLTTIVGLDNHGFQDGDLVYISFIKINSGDPDINDPDSFFGTFTVKSIPVDDPLYSNKDNLFIIDLPRNESFDVSLEVDLFYSSAFLASTVSDNLEVPNRIYFSKVSEPEAVPISNFIDIGAKDEEIKRILALRDNLFILKDDGVFIVSGTSAPDFSVRLLDNVRILAPDSAVVLNNQIYALTEQGVTMITDSGAGIISRGIENLLDEVINSRYDWNRNTFGIPYENDRAYILFAPSDSNDTSATQAFRYNIFERTWSRWEYPATCGLVAQKDTRLYLGNGERNYVVQERKDFSYNDHADRDFNILISPQGIIEDTVKISSTEGVEIGDVITQTQDVTIAYLNNRLLLRMDTFDTGLIPPTGSTFIDSFSAKPGDNMRDKLQALNDYLVTINPAVTDGVFTSNNLKEQVDLLVDELNSAESITTLKDYKKPETVTYETYILEIDAPNNIVTVKAQRPFLQGDITIYKHINKVVEWNPQHFGDPSAVKQVREATIMFDQNNFNEAFAKFGSDIEQALTTVQFRGKGKGYWSDLPWGEANHYWGGNGNDIPYRTIVPRGKQKCRYLTMVFEHNNAREYFRILGISGVVRVISSRGYR